MVPTDRDGPAAPEEVSWYRKHSGLGATASMRRLPIHYIYVLCSVSSSHLLSDTSSYGGSARAFPGAPK
jgi:hypothetical protein